MHSPRSAFGVGCALMIATGGAAHAAGGTWTPLSNTAPFNATNALLMTDGTVMVHEGESKRWFSLKPDSTGSYVHGTWTQKASLPIISGTQYAPLYYASAVLPDGRLILVGGEYNVSGDAVWTNKAAIYDPHANKWKAVAPPSGWNKIGDAQSVVLANGTFMVANPLTFQSATLNASTLKWTVNPGVGKHDGNDEEGWTLLPDGSVLTVDTNNGSTPYAERFYSGGWHKDGTPPALIGQGHEIGPGVLRPNKTVFWVGSGNDAGTQAVKTGIYTPPSTLTGVGKWKAGPNGPSSGGKRLGAKDGPAALLVSGNVLIQLSPGYNAPSHFYEFDGTKLVSVPGPPHTSQIPAFVGRMLCLPSGEIMYADGSNDVEIYKPTGTFSSSWRPVISSYSSTIVHAKSYTIKGVRFNGMSQCGSYGDDAQSATNYPLVRITNKTTHHVYYLKTHSHSSMAVNSTATVSTTFDVPSNQPVGAYTLEVVANGIPSVTKSITVK